MIIQTILQIIFSLFAVFGFYFAIKLALFYISYDRNIRKSIKIISQINENDNEVTRELKEMCARSLRRLLGIK